MLIALLIFTTCCSASHNSKNNPSENANDSIIGVITLDDHFDGKDTVRILNQDGSSWHKFSYSYDDSDGVYDFYNESFRPFAFNPDGYSLALTAVSRNGDKFEVIVNEETGLKKYIVVNQKSGLTFKTCSEFLTSSFAVSFDQNSNPLRKTIAGEKIGLKKSDNFLVRPLEINKDWLKVQYEDLSTKTKTEGWIRWKDSKKIIIQVHSD